MQNLQLSSFKCSKRFLKKPATTSFPLKPLLQDKQHTYFLVHCRCKNSLKVVSTIQRPPQFPLSNFTEEVEATEMSAFQTYHGTTTTLYHCIPSSTNLSHRFTCLDQTGKLPKMASEVMQTVQPVRRQQKRIPCGQNVNTITLLNNGKEKNKEA